MGVYSLLPALAACKSIDNGIGRQAFRGRQRNKQFDAAILASRGRRYPRGYMETAMQWLVLSTNN